MHMRSADMSAIDVLSPRDPHGPGLRFRIANELQVAAPPRAPRRQRPLAHARAQTRPARSPQYFAREYDPADADHHLVLRFSSAADMQRFVTLALPTVRAVAAGVAGSAAGPVGSAGSLLCAVQTETI